MSQGGGDGLTPEPGSVEQIMLKVKAQEFRGVVHVKAQPLNGQALFDVFGLRQDVGLPLGCRDCLASPEGKIVTWFTGL